MDGDHGRALLVLCGVLTCYVGALRACPDECQCPASNNHVTCVGAELTEVPRNLPPSTTHLDLTGNGLHALTTGALAHMRSVINLKMKDNQVETIHEGAFEALQSLQELDMSGNRLSALTEFTFTGAASTLTHLDLSNNRLTEVDLGFVGMKELSRLDLRNNRITRITQFTFRDLTSLRYLLLAGNAIGDIDKRAFRKLEKLMYLVLKGNPIGGVERFQFNSYFLSYVDFSECGLTAVPRGLPSSIRYLQLRRNNMTVVARRAFQDCPYVSILVLDENGITEIQERTFEHMTYLQQLWLNNNKLRHVPRQLPPSLQRLLMDSNRVVLLEDVFPDESQLHTLSFMGNNITRVSYATFYRLPRLKSVDVSNNRIQHVYGNTFIESGELRTLQLSKNPLQYFHSRAFHGLAALQALSLAYIGTAVYMHDDIFDDLTAVTKLDLDASPRIIAAVLGSERLARAFPAVEDLSLQSSELAHLRPDFPDLFPYLGVLHISSTRWHCDTALMWMRNWLLAGHVQVANKENLKCFTPRHLYDRSIIALGDNEFVEATEAPASTRHTARLTTFRPTLSTLVTTTRRPVTPAPTSSAPARTSTTGAPARTSDAGEDGAGDLEEDTFNINLKDLYEADELDESDEKYPGFSPERGPGEGGLASSDRPMTWEEYLAKGNAKEGHVGAPPDSDESKYSPDGGADDAKSGEVQNDVLEIHTLAPREGDAQPTMVAPSHGGGAGGNGTLIIVIATTLATVIIAAVIIALIVYLSRKQRTGSAAATAKKTNKKAEQNGGGALYKNGGIKYQNRNDVLYFMPGTGGEGSTTDSIQTTTSREAMALIPGRDINHEGPLRVYKWEDF